MSVTLNTLIWQLAECRCSTYSPLSFCLKVSIWMRNGTPFSPPCFLGVNSVLMQCTLPRPPQTHNYTMIQSSSTGCTIRVINSVCVCARITSHLYEYRRMFGNIPQKLSSIKLGRVGAGFGNTHTHRDIYNKYETLRDFINQHISGKDSKISHSVSKMYQCRGDGRQGDSTSSLPAADAPCTAASGHETQLSLYSTHTDAQIIAAVFLVCIEQPNICNVDC